MATNLASASTGGYWILRKLLSQDNLGLDKPYSSGIQGKVANGKNEAPGRALAHSEIDLGGRVGLGHELVRALIKEAYPVGLPDPEQEPVPRREDLQPLALQVVHAGKSGQLRGRDRQVFHLGFDDAEDDDGDPVCDSPRAGP